jgi:hypothetical protein
MAEVVRELVFVGLGAGASYIGSAAHTDSVMEDERCKRHIATPPFRRADHPVPAGSTSISVKFPFTLPPEAKYGVLVTPHWNTTVWVTDKTGDGFKINFGTAPTADSHVDWLVFHTPPKELIDEYSARIEAIKKKMTSLVEREFERV